MRDRNTTRLDLRRLSHRGSTPVAWQAGEGDLAALASRLGIVVVAAVALDGEIRPEGDDGFLIEARLRAQVVQSCVVTLAPVPATIEADVLRRYMAGLTQPEGGEHESPDDDSIEPLPDWIDLAEIAGEALSLALPDYPRAVLASDDPANRASTATLPDGMAEAAPATRANRPFAGLAEQIAAPSLPRGPVRGEAGNG